MTRLIQFMLILVSSSVRSRLSLQAENAALRHQLSVYRKSGQRPRIRPADRLLWSVMSRLWSGSPKIVAELAKLGIEVAKSTVEKYRPRRDRPPSPTWRTFLDQHLRDLVSIDFFIVPDGDFSSVVRLRRACPRPTANCSLQCDGTSNGAVDGATDCRSVSV